MAPITKSMINKTDKHYEGIFKCWYNTHKPLGNDAFPLLDDFLVVILQEWLPPLNCELTWIVSADSKWGTGGHQKEKMVAKQK